MNLLKKWKYVLEIGNLPDGEKMDFFSKWVIITRAQVVSMTVTSALVGAILAFSAGHFNWVYLAVVIAALILAHMSNNLINDYFDYKQGLDTPDYHRVQYSPHPIVSGLLTEKKLIITFLIFGVFELCAALYLWKQTGWPVIVFAITGFLLSVFYVAPPLKLKYRGLGEAAIFLIWGPLITVGTYYVMAGSMPWQIWLASIPYGLVVTNVILGKHLDKFEKDKEKGVKTLPVVFGWKNAVIFTRINSAMFYLSVILLVLFKVITPFALIAFFSIGRFKYFMDVLSSKRPDTQPAGFPNLWPLWYVVWAFWFNKLAGGLFILGLIAGCLPWFKF
jgi:1,4-dihydroxy-2-naphthoate octaprenyltransferase